MNNLFVYICNGKIVTLFIYYPFYTNIIRKEVLLFSLLKKCFKPGVLNTRKFKTGSIFSSKI